MKTFLLSVFIIFINCSSMIGYPLKKVEFPSGSEESGEIFAYNVLDLASPESEIDDNFDIKPEPKPKPQFRIDAANVPCSNSSLNFCEEVSQHIYPSQHVKTMLAKTADLYANFFNKIETRDDFPDSINLCDTYRRKIYPTAARNVDSDWRFVVNQGEYRQPIRVELCQKRSSQCAFSDSFPPGYASSCKQKFTKIPLLSLNDDGEMSTFEYEFPSHCQCDLHRVKSTKKRPHRRN